MFSLETTSPSPLPLCTFSSHTHFKQLTTEQHVSNFLHAVRNHSSATSPQLPRPRAPQEAGEQQAIHGHPCPPQDEAKALQRT